MADAIRVCKLSLPEGDYKALETTSIPKGAIWQVIAGTRKSEAPLGFEEYHVIGHPNGYAKAPKIRFALLQRHRDELVYCEVSSPRCGVRIIWFKRKENLGFDFWVLDRTNGDAEEVCVTS
jgi:hypothetical protein